MKPFKFLSKNIQPDVALLPGIYLNDNGTYYGVAYEQMRRFIMNTMIYTGPSLVEMFRDSVREQTDYGLYIIDNVFIFDNYRQISMIYYPEYDPHVTINIDWLWFDNNDFRIQEITREVSIGPL